MRTVRSDGLLTKFTVVTFGTAEFSRSLEIQKRNSLKFGANRHITYNVRSPPVMRALSENPILTSHLHGYGLWIWKPYIMLDAMDQVEPGDYIVYLDAGVAPVADMKPWFDFLLGKAVNVFAPVPPTPLKAYTKRDCFVLMQGDNSNFYNTPILSAGIQAHQNVRKSLDFLNELKGLMRDPRLLMDGESLFGLPNHENFIAHRHDQSILTLLAKRYGYPANREPTQYGIWTAQARNAYIASGAAAPEMLNEDYPQVLDVHRGRNRRNALLYFIWRIKRKLSPIRRGAISI
jgi:hypothetical protein